MVDIGYYNADPKRYRELVNSFYDEYKEITLPPEYAYFIQKDLIRFLIRLARYKFVARLIKETDHILEVGCGSGLGSIFLGQHCAHVTGLEIKRSEVEDARAMNRRKNVEFMVEDFFNLRIERQFDVVVSLDVIEHMPMEQGSELICAISRRVKPTGMAVIGTPSIYSYDYQSELSKASHVKCYDQQELIELMERYFHRILPFCMNDELVHTGFSKLAWYYFLVACVPGEK